MVLQPRPLQRADLGKLCTTLYCDSLRVTFGLRREGGGGGLELDDGWFFHSSVHESTMYFAVSLPHVAQAIHG